MREPLTRSKRVNFTVKPVSDEIVTVVLTELYYLIILLYGSARNKETKCERRPLRMTVWKKYMLIVFSRIMNIHERRLFMIRFCRLRKVVAHEPRSEPSTCNYYCVPCLSCDKLGQCVVQFFSGLAFWHMSSGLWYWRAEVCRPT